MKITSRICALFVFMFAACGQLFAQNTSYFIKVSNAVFNEINMGFERTVWSQDPEVDALFMALRIQRVEKAFQLDHPDLRQILLVSMPPISLADRFAIQKASWVEYIEPVPEYEVFYTPNDVHTNQWNLQKIKATGAWDVNRNASSVVIAIVDDAVLTTHADLSSNIWVNTGEVLNGVDDDGNGYIDDVNGYDVADNDADPRPPATASSHSFSHGTHCAGIASAVTDNNTGIASIGFNARIMAVKCAPSSSSGQSLPAAYKGVEYAIASGADIISMSWGGGSFSNTYQALFNVAHSKDIVLVAAAGNSNVSTPMYPAAYQHVISVAASDQNDNKAGFSNYGSTIDVSAPGVDIYSTVAGSTPYDKMSGTSMACPLVSGLCALMRGQSPGMLPDSVEACLERTADPIDHLNTTYTGQLGAGRINAEEAMNCAKGVVNAGFDPDAALICPGGQVQFTARSMGVSGMSFQWTFPGGAPATSTSPNPLVTYSTAGVYNVSLTVSDGSNSDQVTRTQIITVSKPSATLGNASTIQRGGTGYVKVNLLGTPPFSITYTDGVTNTTISGILTNTYFLPVTPDDTTYYTLVNMSDSRCNGNVSGIDTMNVIPRDSSCSGEGFALRFEVDRKVIISRTAIDPNGNIYACGRTETSSGAFKGFLIKFNSSGELVWSREYPGMLTLSFITIAPSNNDIMVSGMNTGDVVVARVNPNGNVIWYKKYNYSNERYYYGIVPSDNNSFIIGGMGTGVSGDDLYALKLDGSNGNVIWNYSYHNGDDQLAVMNPNGKDGVYFSGNLSANGAIAEIDKNGNLIHHFAFTDRYNTQYVDRYGNDVVVVNSAQYATGVDLSVSRLDLNAAGGPQVKWTTKFGPKSRIWTDIVGVNDYTGNIYVSFYGDADQTSKLALLDGNGNLKELNTSDFPGTLRFAFDKDFVVLMGSKNVGSKHEIIMVKRKDTAGISNCYFEPLNQSGSSGSLSVSAKPFTRTQRTFTSTTPSFNTASPNITRGCICFNPEVSASELSICSGDSVQLSVTDEGLYEWLPANGLRSTDLQLREPWVKPTTSTQYEVKVSNCGCPEDTLRITVNVKGSGGLGLRNDTTLCMGDTLNLEVTGGLNQYQWTPAYNMISVSQSKKRVHPDVDTTYYVTALTSDLCDVSDSIFIQVKPCCDTATQFSVNDPLLCLGEDASFTNRSRKWGAMSYRWEFPGASNMTGFNGYQPPIVQYSQAGNYQVLLITDGPCGLDTAIGYLSVIDFKYDIGNDTFACRDVAVQLGRSAVSDYDYSWSPTIGLDDPLRSDPTFTLDQSRQFVLTITDRVTGCVAIDTVNVEEYELDFELRDTTICRADAITLDFSHLQYDFLWHDGSVDPRYEVKLSDSEIWCEVTYGSCVADDTMTVRHIECSCLTFVPNIFTPNGDPWNQTFKPVTSCTVKNYYFTIYNRWGEKIFESDDQDMVWDATYRGKEVPDGVYFWILDYSVYTLNNRLELETISGTVTVAR